MSTAAISARVTVSSAAADCRLNEPYLGNRTASTYPVLGADHDCKHRDRGTRSGQQLCHNRPARREGGLRHFAIVSAGYVHGVQCPGTRFSR
jgi:hypothetical protein